MDPQVPSSEETNQGLDFDVGLSLHEWATRWSELEESRRDDEAEALGGAVELLDEMYRELGIPEVAPDDPSTEVLPRILGEVRDVNRRAQNDSALTAEELDDAWAAARDAFDALVAGSRDLPDSEV